MSPLEPVAASTQSHDKFGFHRVDWKCSWPATPTHLSQPTNSSLDRVRGPRGWDGEVRGREKEMEAWRREGGLMKMMQRGLGEEGNKVVELQGKRRWWEQKAGMAEKWGSRGWERRQEEWGRTMGEEGKDGKTERRGSSSACRFPLWPLSWDALISLESKSWRDVHSETIGWKVLCIVVLAHPVGDWTVCGLSDSSSREASSPWPCGDFLNVWMYFSLLFWLKYISNIWTDCQQIRTWVTFSLHSNLVRLYNISSTFLLVLSSPRWLFPDRQWMM